MQRAITVQCPMYTTHLIMQINKASYAAQTLNKQGILGDFSSEACRVVSAALACNTSCNLEMYYITALWFFVLAFMHEP